MQQLTEQKTGWAGPDNGDFGFHASNLSVALKAHALQRIVIVVSCIFDG
jgi:hypothetical protein